MIYSAFLWLVNYTTKKTIIYSLLILVEPYEFIFKDVSNMNSFFEILNQQLALTIILLSIKKRSREDGLNTLSTY